MASQFAKGVAFVSVAIWCALLFAVPFARAENHPAGSPASLYLEPGTGTFTVGNTFTVSLYLNTGGNDINAVDAVLEFPPDKLQVVNPTAGKSIISTWVVQPNFNNTTGRLRFQGVIPSPGINTSAGLVSQVTFRANALGKAVIRIKDESRVLLNDGRGTDALGHRSNSIVTLVLPPPAGPLVSSPTHPDQEKWYANKTATFEWQNEDAIEAYSFVLNDRPVDAPDDIPDASRNNRITYQNVAEGQHYFHIKALRGGVWSGLTHYLIRVDSEPPADFPIEIAPFARSTTRRPSITFETTDSLSGVNHYEIKVVRLDPPAGKHEPPKDQGLFVEVSSPYVPELEFGSYDVIVRVYDHAGNYLQKIQRLDVVTRIFDIIRGQGLRFRSNLIIPWLWVYIAALFIVLGLSYGTYAAWRHHHAVAHRLEIKQLPDEVKRQLEELRALKERYGSEPQNPGAPPAHSAAMILLFLGALAWFSFIPSARAEQVELAPPIVTLVSSNITNQEIFYIGGKSDAPGSQVVIYLQNLETGGTLSETADVDKQGNWFYSHRTFLSSGHYLMWTQGKIGGILSPPSPQIQLAVSPTALQFGASRLSYETIYLFITLFLLGVIGTLAGFWIYHTRAAREKHARLMETVREAEASIKRGFALLHRDLQAEFDLMKKAKLTRSLSLEEKQNEERILRDLGTVEQYVGREIWEVEHTE
jgi:hypothetical protein